MLLACGSAAVHVDGQRTGGRVADTARRASTVISRYSDTFLLFKIKIILISNETSITVCVMQLHSVYWQARLQSTFKNKTEILKRNAKGEGRPRILYLTTTCSYTLLLLLL